MLENFANIVDRLFVVAVGLEVKVVKLVGGKSRYLARKNSALCLERRQESQIGFTLRTREASRVYSVPVGDSGGVSVFFFNSSALVTTSI